MFDEYIAGKGNDYAITVVLSVGLIGLVSKMPGHSKISITQIYAKVVERKFGEY